MAEILLKLLLKNLLMIISQIIYDNYKKEPQEFIDGLKEIGIHQKLRSCPY